MLEVHHHILALPKSPTSVASSNNNKTWKGLFCPLYSYNKMDVDLAMLFPLSYLAVLAFSLSKSSLWGMSTADHRDKAQLRERVLAREIFSLWCPLLPTSGVSRTFCILQAQSHPKAQARSSFSPLAAQTRSPQGNFPLFKSPVKYFVWLKLRYPTISQLQPAWTKGC